MNWSDEQIAIFEWFANGKGALVVQARAGTGKTTTIKASFEHAPENKILYAVFNKKNQKEAEGKITDSRVEVKTLHSLGFAFIKRLWSNAKPDNDIENERVEKALEAIGAFNVSPEVVGQIVRLVGFAKNTTINPSLQDLAKLAEEQDIDFSFLNFDGCQVALDALLLSKERDAAGRISFNDMVWLPCALNLVRPWFDLVVIDEAQDMNLPQLTMAKGACKPGGRVVVVGDDRQAIYGFRGAVQNGMQMMKMTLRASVLGLTTTYRCPSKVVALANAIVPDYHAAPEAPEGLVENINEAKMVASAKPGDAILSRLNAPLMPLALSFLRNNVPARIEGRDIGRQLVGMVRSMKAKNVPQFIERVQAWERTQHERLAKARNAEKKLEQVSDVAKTLVAIAEGAKSVNDIEVRLNSLFQDTDEKSLPAIILSSVHKAKGLEWKKVFILSSTFRQAKGGEEANIYYVALTRSQRELYLVAGGGAAPTPTTSTPEPSVPAPSAAAPSVEAPAPKVEAPKAIRLDSSSLPQGMVFHRVGNVIKHESVEYVCDMVNASRARFTCLTRVKKTITPLGGETKEIERAPRQVSLSVSVEPSSILRKMSQEEVEAFLTRGARSERGSTNQSGVGNTESNDMANKTGELGRAGFIHKLRDSGTKKDETYEKAKAKFKKLTPGLFDKIWKRSARGEGKPAAKAPTSKAPAKETTSKKGAKAPAKGAAKGKDATKGKKSSTPPPRSKVAPTKAPEAPAAASSTPAEPSVPAATSTTQASS